MNGLTAVTFEASTWFVDFSDFLAKALVEDISSLLTLLLVCPSSCDIVTPPDEREGLRRGGELQIATKFSITCETLSSFPLLYLGLDTPYLLTEDDA